MPYKYDLCNACCVVGEVNDDTTFCGVKFAVGSFLWKVSGLFSTTIHSSLNVQAVNTDATGISWDGTDATWMGNTDPNTLYLTSGQFTSTLKQSVDITSISSIAIRGVSWDSVETLICENTGDLSKLIALSGKFTDTLRRSILVSTIASGSSSPHDIAYRESDGATLFTNQGIGDDNKNYITASPRFTTTVSASHKWADVRAGLHAGISWEGSNAILGIRDTVSAVRKLVQLTAFTTTILKSEDVSSIAAEIGGINSNLTTVG